ncbi:MAG: AMP-binding protein [Actinomycetota bacterium]|nr:AMP-binding protein [Actinomycetota bacterium]
MRTGAASTGDGRSGPFVPLAASDPDGPAITSATGTLTWSQLEASARRYANAVRRLGLDDDDRVAVMSLNRTEWVQALVGNLRGGTRHVPINWHLTAGEVAYVLADSKARLLLVGPEHADVGRAAAEEAGVEHVVVLGDEFAALLADAPDHEPENTHAGGVLTYTSGTTGRQKGVRRSDHVTGLDQVMATYARVGEAWRMTRGGVHLGVCPLYHATPQGMALFCVALGQHQVQVPRFDAEETLRLIEAHRVTSIHLVPTQLIRLLRLPDEVRARHDLSSLEGVWHGAAPCPAWVKRAAIDWLGPIVTEYFGSSEGTGPLIATSEEWLAHPGTVGRPAPWIEISVLDDDHDEVPTGEVGTLWFRRPEGPPTYEGDEEKSRSIRLDDGRFTVGDVGWLDDDGFVYLADRKIDMIISGGVNIYPSETEAILSQHPAVADCAVFGVPDPEWGEQVKAAVELAPGAETDPDELIAWCAERIARYKCPRSIDVHDALPREASGKLKKRVLRDAYREAAGPGR